MISTVYDSIASLKNKEHKVKSFFISFYCIGFIGLIFPLTTPLFLKLTPYALIFSFMAVMLFHSDFKGIKTYIFFSVVFAAGYFIELIGVNRGVIFGEYRYGQGLGLKLWNTPLLIGMNWLMMVYLSGSVVSLMNLRVIPSILIASFIMLLYDVLMEQVASDLDMWYWANNTIPLQNYIAWFIIALIFHIGIKIVGIKTENKIAPVILICHAAFFSLLFLFYRFIA